MVFHFQDWFATHFIEHLKEVALLSILSHNWINMYYWGNLLLMFINGSIQRHIPLKSFRDTQIDIHETHNPNDFFHPIWIYTNLSFRLKWYIKGSYIPIIDFIEMVFFFGRYIYWCPKTMKFIMGDVFWV